jgi:hypothetical protein
MVVSPATFWWMAELANRVSASAATYTTTSACAALPACRRTSSTT